MSHIILDKVSLISEYKKINKIILDDISLKFKNGDRIGIIGKNGAGKSSLLKIMSNIYQPTSGSINIHGSINSLISIGFDASPDETGREIINLKLIFFNIKSSERKYMVDSIIEFSELGESIDMPFKFYSAGMRLRLNYAVIHFVKREILIMDEWIGSGDKTFTKKISYSLRKKVTESDIFIIATHSQNLLKKLCDKVIWMDYGSIKKIGKTNTILKSYNEYYKN